MAGLIVVSALGVAREYRLSAQSASIDAGMPAELRMAGALEVTRRVAARLRYLTKQGTEDDAAPWPFRTQADNLLSGSGCGHAAAALGGEFLSHGRAFRIVQINLREAGASHIMLETQDDDRRWVLIDALDGHGFPRPLDGRLLGIDEIRALPIKERYWLAEEYRSGDWSLFMPYQRTNWSRLGPLEDVFRALAGDDWMREVSLRAAMIQADRRLAEIAVFAIMLLAVARVLAGRNHARKPVS